MHIKYNCLNLIFFFLNPCQLSGNKHHYSVLEFCKRVQLLFSSFIYYQNPSRCVAHPFLGDVETAKKQAQQNMKTCC